MIYRSDMVTDSRHPQGSCDWKDAWSCWEEIKKMIAHFDIRLSDIAYEEVETSTWDRPGDHGVGLTFAIIDRHLLPLGYQIVQYDTGGDFYVFQIIPEADWPERDVEDIIREEMGYV